MRNSGRNKSKPAQDTTLRKIRHYWPKLMLWAQNVNALFEQLGEVNDAQTQRLDIARDRLDLARAAIKDLQARVEALENPPA